MAVNNKSSRSKTKNEEDDIRLDVDVWDVSINIYLYAQFFPVDLAYMIERVSNLYKNFTTGLPLNFYSNLIKVQNRMNDTNNI